jgi:ABC-type transporter Mla subunit MlaD
MSAIAIGMNLMLAGLLTVALVMGYRLNARLKALRESHEGFARAVADLDAAAARAEQGLADLRAATDEAHDALADRIEKARTLTAKLDRQLQAAPSFAGRAAEPVSETDVERVTQRLGSLLSAAREPRPQRETPRREPVAPRARPTFDDDLFDAPAERAPLRARAGVR